MGHDHQLRIDSHHHFWNYSPEQYGWIGGDMAMLRRDFGPDDLLREIEAVELGGVVSVQARQSLVETEWLLQLADQHDFIRGVVGWVPLADDSSRDAIERFSHSAWFKAVRHVVQDEPDDGFILGADFNRGVEILKDYGLVYDILIFAKHLQNSIQFVDRHPEQVFVLDHIAKPTIREQQFDADWKLNLLELAKRENVSCKFSGVVTEVRDESWSLDTIRPYWDVAWEAFGSDRMMFGSDWPVCLLRTGYQRWYSVVSEVTSQLSDAEQAKFWGQNAARVYSL